MSGRSQIPLPIRYYAIARFASSTGDSDQNVEWLGSLCLSVGILVKRNTPKLFVSPLSPNICFHLIQETL
jgi:hypothetical protein